MLAWNERLMVIRAMQKYGGSFVQQLGKTLQCADEENAELLINLFRYKYPDYFPEGDKYKAAKSSYDWETA